MAETKKNRAEKEIEETTDVEGESEKEIVEETPEQKTERKQRENIERLERSADDFIEAQKIKTLQTELTTEAVELENPRTVLTLEKQRRRLSKKRGFLSAVKKNWRKASFKLRLIKNPERLLTIIDYLEDSIAKVEHQYINVETDEVAETIKHYQEQGFRAREGGPGFEKNEVAISIDKDIPYQFRTQDLKKIARLSEAAGDPIENIERLQGFGFNITNYDFELDNYFEELLSLVSLPEINNTLIKLEQTGFRGGYYSVGSEQSQPAVQLIKRITGPNITDRLLNTTAQLRLKAMNQKSQQKLNFLCLEDYLAISQDERGLELFCFLAPSCDFSKLDNVKNFRLLQAENLIEPLNNLRDSGINVPSVPNLFNLRYYSNIEDRVEETKKTIDKIKNFINGQDLKDFLGDKDFSEFAIKASALLNKKFYFGEIERFRKLQECPGALAGLEALRRLNIGFEQWQWDNYFSDILALLQNPEKMGVLTDPEFEALTKTLQEKFGYQPNFNDFQYKTEGIFYFFKNESAREKITSEQGIGLINYLGKFQFDKIDCYLELLESPTILTTLQKLEATFGYHYGKSRDFPYRLDDLAEISQNQERQEALFSEEAKKNFQNLQQKIDYHFQIDDINALAHMAKFGFSNAKLEEFFLGENDKFFEKDYQFIKKSVKHYNLSGIERVLLMEQNFKDMVIKLAENFDYTYESHSNSATYQKDDAAIDELSKNQDLQKRLFDKERIKLIQQLRESASYQFNIQHIQGVNSLLEIPLGLGNLAKEMQEHKLYYRFEPKDTANLVKFAEQKDNLLFFLDSLRQTRVYYPFRIEDVGNLIKTIAHTPAKASEKIALVAQIIPDYQFKPDEIASLEPFIEKDYQLSDLQDLKQLFNQYKASPEDKLTVARLPGLVTFRENKEEILTAKEQVDKITFTGMDPISHAAIFKTIAENNLLPEIKFLKEIGTGFNLYQVEAIKDLQQKGFVDDIKKIRESLPDFHYRFSSASEYNIATGRIETTNIVDPYEILALDGIGNNNVFSVLSAIENTKEGEDMARNFGSGLMRQLRRNDPVLKDAPADKGQPIAQERYGYFYQAIKNLNEKMRNEQGPAFGHRRIFNNIHLLRFLARQPERLEEVKQIPEKAPFLFNTLLATDGRLASNQDNIIRDIFSNGNALRRAQEIEAIFARKVPYWKQLFLFTQTRLGDQLAAATSAYPLTKINNTSWQGLVKRHKTIKEKNPEKLTRLEAVVANPAVRAQLINGEIQAIPFRDLSGAYKRVVFRDYLKQTIETSRSHKAKKEADARNKRDTPEQLHLKSEMFLHGSAIDHLRPVLLSGNLPQEALGESAGTDNYPFHVDFTRVEETLIKDKGTKDALMSSRSSGYGIGGKLAADGQIFYIYDRETTNWEKDRVCTTGSSDHALMLGGMPATEIKAVVLRSADKTLSEAKNIILENGFYIPVYDLEGKLLFSEEEYNQTFKELNLKVSVDEIWDMSMKVGAQAGSNEGGYYVSPTKKGPVEYYVKMAQATRKEQIWNERLADKIYEKMGLPVPETRVVLVENGIGHASRVLKNGKEGAGPDLKDGFLLDCLMANWDITKSDNTLIANGVTYRIDNGGALLFRAQGERRDNFPNQVAELTSMKSGYAGLTKNETLKQARAIKRTLTDEVIDKLVDSVQLRQADRNFLKEKLKARRDFIISVIVEEKIPESTTEQLKQQAEVLDILKSKNLLGNVHLAEIIPDWTRFTGEEGYQHNKELLGRHIENVIKELQEIPEWATLDDDEKNLSLIAGLFHDFGKPTGTVAAAIERDFAHEVASIFMASNYMVQLGFPQKDIKTVEAVIGFDGIVSDIARNKVRDEAKKMSPLELKKQMGSESAIKILRVVNKADAIATAGKSSFTAIEKKYNAFFDEMLQTTP